MPLIRRGNGADSSRKQQRVTGTFDPRTDWSPYARDPCPTSVEPIDPTYYFETSMLANLYLLGAVVKDVPMPARYQSEVSNMLIYRIVFQFPLKLFGTFLKRLVLKNYIYDFTMESIYILVGFPLLAFGLTFGIDKWIEYARQKGITAPTGTVMLATLSVLLGIQLLLSAIEIDLRSVPKEPLSPPL
jgi:hypothetical protein